MKALDRLAGTLYDLEARHRRRRLIPQAGLDFSSNDYLGLAGSDVLREAAADGLARGVPLGSGGSRLLRGNHAEHEALEAFAASFFGTEAALYMVGGFQANQAIFAALPGPDDLVLHDELVHASTHDGMRAGRATTRSFAHNDALDAARVLEAWRNDGGTGQVWIAVESLYSMEGDLAPLDALDALACAQDAILVVDEAHATGLFGPQGKGLAHGLKAELLTLHTCGKGLGVSGGLVCGRRVLIDMLVNRARPFIFATAPAPFTAALVHAALRHLDSDGTLVEAARTRMAFAHAEARRHGVAEQWLDSQIIPIIIGEDAPTMQIAAALQAEGFDIRGIRPPTVPKGTSRLRLSITGNVSHADITSLFETLSLQRRAAA